MNVKDVFLEWVFPLLGGIVGTLMFMAPLKAVLEGTRRRCAALTETRPGSLTRFAHHPQPGRAEISVL